jgi:hypothetical protein
VVSAKNKRNAGVTISSENVVILRWKNFLPQKTEDKRGQRYGASVTRLGKVLAHWAILYVLKQFFITAVPHILGNLLWLWLWQ